MSVIRERDKKDKWDRSPRKDECKTERKDDRRQTEGGKKERKQRQKWWKKRLLTEKLSRKVRKAQRNRWIIWGREEGRVKKRDKWKQNYYRNWKKWNINRKKKRRQRNRKCINSTVLAKHHATEPLCPNPTFEETPIINTYNSFISVQFTRRDKTQTVKLKRTINKLKKRHGHYSGCNKKCLT